MNEITLDKIRIGMRQAFAEELIYDPQFTVYFDARMQMVVADMRAYVLGENQTPIKYPSDWWQAFKARWFPYWLKKRYPVMYKKINVDVVYPELDISMPERRHSVLISGPYEEVQ